VGDYCEEQICNDYACAVTVIGVNVGLVSYPITGFYTGDSAPVENLSFVRSNNMQKGNKRQNTGILQRQSTFSSRVVLTNENCDV
jgi:hypothetical protein